MKASVNMLKGETAEQRAKDLYIKKWQDMLSDVDEETRNKILEKQVLKYEKLLWLIAHENMTPEFWERTSKANNDPDIKAKADKAADTVRKEFKDDIDFEHLTKGYTEWELANDGIAYNLGAIRYILEGEWYEDT